nr:hypothetical protein BaRGS_020744 [Batillaria attramentaria]
MRRKPRSKSRSREKEEKGGEEEEDGQQQSSLSDKKPLPKAGLHTLNKFPKQFILSSREDDALMDLERSLSESDVAGWSEDVSYDAEEQRRLEREMEGFSDLDYMVPDHLEQLLRQEGVSDQAVDNTVMLGRLLNDRAAYLNHMYHIRRRKFLARPSRHSRLPPINKGQRRTRSQEREPEVTPFSNDVEARRDRRQNRQKPWTKTSNVFPTAPQLPGIPTNTPGDNDNTDTSEPEAEPHVPEEVSSLYFRSDIEREKWQTERNEEITSTLPDFVHPRVVLISSNVPRCNSMVKAIRKGDKHIIYIVYDFASWTLPDVLATVRSELDKYSPGCRATSLMLICQGAQGCIYLLRKIVLTPQKLKRVQYQHVREFWAALGTMMSKADPDNTIFHLLGGSLDNAQGRLLLQEIRSAILPSQVQIHTVDEATELGREAIEFYFDFRKFLLWRSKSDSRSLLDYTDITRSWSSLAEAAEDMNLD